VTEKPETPFDSLEGSHEFVILFAEAIGEARRDIEAEIQAAVAEGAEHRRQALQLVSYKLNKLELNIQSSRRILDDLQSLRRLLLAERSGNAEAAAAEIETPEAWSEEEVVRGD
jgi:hypothetical protein